MMQGTQLSLRPADFWSSCAAFNAEGKAQLQRVRNAAGHGAVPKSEKPIRVGILGASTVATYALIWPAKRLADVHVKAVAAREANRAEAYARKHGISEAYGNYEQLVSDPELDAIYVATPNGLHGQWVEAALRAGKHVLCEKPFTANAAEARRLQDLAQRSGLLCREAFHYKEHPANAALAALVQGGAVGDLHSLDAKVLIPAWAFGGGDIRFRADLAGGTMMDAGCYCAHALRFFPGVTHPRVTAASAPQVLPGGVDVAMQAQLAYPDNRRGQAAIKPSSSSSSSSQRSSSSRSGGAVGQLEASLRSPKLWPVTQFTAVGSRGSISIDNFIMPFVGHSITLRQHSDQLAELTNDSAELLAAAGLLPSPLELSSSSRGGEMLPYLPLPPAVLSSSGTKGTVRQGGGGVLRMLRGGRANSERDESLVTQLSVYGSGESNYYYQLQRFIQDTQVLLLPTSSSSELERVALAQAADAADALGNMALVDDIYTAAGLPLRVPTAQYQAASKAISV